MTIGTSIAIAAIWAGAVGSIYVTGWKRAGAAIVIVSATLLTLAVITP